MAQLKNGNVQAECPDCGTLTTFEATAGGHEFGAFDAPPGVTDVYFHEYARRWILLRCAGCHRGGMALVAYTRGDGEPASLSEFLPKSAPCLPLPDDVPEGIENEFREAEVCIGVEANRGAAALLRSTLEKSLLECGYTDAVVRELDAKINMAATDGVISSVRKAKAHSVIRVLGKVVMHGPWKPVPSEEVEAAHKYTHRILEDIFDDWAGTKKRLQEKGRLPAPAAAATAASGS